MTFWSENRGAISFQDLCLCMCRLEKIISEAEQSEPEPSKPVMADDLDLITSSLQRIESLVGYQDLYMYIQIQS